MFFKNKPDTFFQRMEAEGILFNATGISGVEPPLINRGSTPLPLPPLWDTAPNRTLELLVKKSP